MATDLETLVVTLQANMKQYLSEVKRVETTTNATMNQIKRHIESNARRNEMAMTRMGAGMAKGFQRGLASSLRGGLAALGLGGVVSVIGKAIKSVADLADLSQDLGISARNLQVWQRMAVAAGQSGEIMARALSEVAEQSQDAESKLTKLFAVSGKKPTGDVQKDMLTLVKILDDAGSAAQRLRVLEFVFGGKLGRRLAESLRGGPQAFIDELKKADAAGELFTSEQLKRARQLEESWNRVMVRVGDVIAKAVLDNFGNWQNFEDFAVDVAKQIVDAVIEIANAIKQITANLQDAKAAWNNWINGLSYLPDWVKKGLMIPDIGGGLGGGTGAIPEVTQSQAARQRQAGDVLSARYGRTIAAAIIGNLMQESNLNPAAKGRAGEMGIAQWMGPRARGMPGTFSGQLQFLMNELDRDFPDLMRRMQGKSLAEATRMFMAEFEKPGDPRFANRLRQAQGAFERIGGTSVAPEEGAGKNVLPRQWSDEDLANLEQANEIEKEMHDLLVKRNAEVKEFVQSQHDEREMQEALNSQDRERINTIKAQQEARRMNVQIGSEQYNQILREIEATDALTQSQERLAQQAQAMQEVGQMLGSAVSGFVQDLMNGVDAGEALSNMLKRLASQLMDMAIQGLFQNLFGGGMGGGGGLLGGIFGGAGGALSAGGTARAMGGKLAGAGSSGAISIGGATINVAGNADTRTVAMMSKMIEVSEQRQSQRLNREWGQRTARYRNLRAP